NHLAVPAPAWLHVFIPGPETRGQNERQTTMNKPKAEISAELDSILPAITAIANNCGRLATFRVGADNASVVVEIALPCTQPMSIRGEVRYGSEWTVEASGWSWT